MLRLPGGLFLRWGRRGRIWGLRGWTLLPSGHTSSRRPCVPGWHLQPRDGPGGRRAVPQLPARQLLRGRILHAHQLPRRHVLGPERHGVRRWCEQHVSRVHDLPSGSPLCRRQRGAGRVRQGILLSELQRCLQRLPRRPLLRLVDDVRGGDGVAGRQLGECGGPLRRVFQRYVLSRGNGQHPESAHARVPGGELLREGGGQPRGLPGGHVQPARRAGRGDGLQPLAAGVLHRGELHDLHAALQPGLLLSGGIDERVAYTVSRRVLSHRAGRRRRRGLRGLRERRLLPGGERHADGLSAGQLLPHRL